MGFLFKYHLKLHFKPEWWSVYEGVYGQSKDVRAKPIFIDL